MSNNQWVKVSNKKDMPSAEEEVLVVSDGIIHLAMWSAEDHAWLDAFDLLTEYEHVTYWMPLPALPMEVEHVSAN